MTQGTLVDATIIEAPSSTKTKSSNAIRRCIRPRKAISGTWHEGPHWCRCQEWPDPQPGPTAANEHDLNQLGNLLHGEENLSQPMPATKERHSARSWPSGCGLADRRASRQGKNLETASRKNKTAINIEYMKASIRARWSTRFASSSGSSAS